MNKCLFLLLPVLLAGCTASDLESGFDTLVNHNVDSQFHDYGNSQMIINESRVFSSISELNFLESANPFPSELNFSVNDLIYLRFNEWGGYRDFSFSLYERQSLKSVSLDISTFDSFDSSDVGLIPFDDLGVAALKPNTVYLFQMTNQSDQSVYYYEFTTGEADTVKPTVEDVRFENNDLAILFSETVKSWTLKNADNLVLAKDGVDFDADFGNVRTSAGYGWQNAKYFIEYPDLVSGTYELTIRNVKDASGNIIDEYNLTVVKI